MGNSKRKYVYRYPDNPQAESIVVTREIKAKLQLEFKASDVTIWAALTGRRTTELSLKIRQRAAELLAFAADRAEVETKMEQSNG